MKIGNLEVYGVIYRITNILNNKVYIGQTTRGFNKRYSYSGKNIERVYKFHNYRKQNKLDYNSHLLRSIEKYGFDNFIINKIIDFAFSKDELNIKEKVWIKLYNSFNVIYGYNKTEGGDGHTGCKGDLNPQAKKIVQLDLNGEYIKTWSCIAEASDFLQLSPSSISSCCSHSRHIKSVGNFMWLYYDDYNTIKNINPYKKSIKHTKIVQLDLNGKYLNKFNSIKEAIIKLKINGSGISSCINHKKKSYDNYMWISEKEYIKYKNKIQPIKRFHSGRRKRKIVQLDIHNNYIEKFNSISQAVKKMNLENSSRSHIISCCKNKRNTAYGYVWMYYEDYIKSIDNITIIKHINHNFKKVICITTKEVFDNAKIAGKKYNRANSNITHCCKGKGKSAGKHPITGEPLKWMYYDDYIKPKNNMNILHNENSISI